MAEKLSFPNSEHLLPDAEHAEALRPGEHLTVTNEQAKNLLETQAEQAETALQTAEQHAVTDNPLERFQAAEAAATVSEVAPPSKDLISHGLKQELKSIQRKESRPARSFSKVVHQPAIRVVSEVAGKTISRPSGLLGGGILAFVGSSLYLYLTKHVGMPYNYLAFVLFFAGGFVLGLLIEMLVRLATPKKPA